MVSVLPASATGGGNRRRVGNVVGVVLAGVGGGFTDNWDGIVDDVPIGVCVMSNPLKMIFDLMEPIEIIGSQFDWITPLANEVQGFNTLVFSGDTLGADAHQRELRKQGIASRREWIGWNTVNVYIKD